MEMKSIDYLSKAEMQPSINRLMGLLGLDEVKTKAVIAILMDIDDMCDKAMEEAECCTELGDIPMQTMSIPTRTL